jgi:hypothetical protein
VPQEETEDLQRRRKTDQIPAGSSAEVQIYRRSWHSYVARRNLVLVLFASLFFCGLMIARLRLGEARDFSILVGWICVYLAGVWWLTEWRCPRCGKIFANRLWTQKCISCGLSKDEIGRVVGK